MQIRDTHGINCACIIGNRITPPKSRSLRQSTVRIYNLMSSVDCFGIQVTMRAICVRRCMYARYFLEMIIKLIIYILLSEIIKVFIGFSAIKVFLNAHRTKSFKKTIIKYIIILFYQHSKLFIFSFTF